MIFLGHVKADDCLKYMMVGNSNYFFIIYSMCFFNCYLAI